MLRAGQMSGDPLMVANAVEYDTGTWHTTFSASQNGLMMYEPGVKTLGIDFHGWIEKGTPRERSANAGSTKGPDAFRQMGSAWRWLWVIRKRTSG